MLYGDEVCKFCNAADCYIHCSGASDGKHIPDPASIAPADGVEWVIDINCAKCGISGSMRVDPSELKWD